MKESVVHGAMAVAVATAGWGCGQSEREAPPRGWAAPVETSEFLPQGPVVVRDPAPPAIQGGTLIVARDGRTAVAADPDRDLVYFVDVDAAALVRVVALEPGDQPGRVAEDGAGRIHVALRRGGAIASIDRASGAVVARRAVCPAPSGIAYDAAHDLLHVACETGELLSIAPTAAEPKRVVDLGRDLRDVVVRGSELWVTRFRSSELLVLDQSQAVRGSGVRSIFRPTSPDGLPRAAGTAWHLRGDGAMPLLLHQLATTTPPEASGEWGSPDPGACEGRIAPAVTLLSGGDVAPQANTFSITGASGSTDAALAADGTVALAATGMSWGAGQANVVLLPPGTGGTCASGQSLSLPGEVTAVAFDGHGRLVVQSRQPAFLALFDDHHQRRIVALSGDDRTDTGLALFHAESKTHVACASCHPTGREDGNVWTFVADEPRRTQSLAQPLASTAPYHWDGAMANVPQLVHEVFETRMSGDRLDGDQLKALEHFIFSQPPPPRRLARDPAAAARGAALFARSDTGCSGCHAGAAFSNNATIDVGTGMAAQVPSLIGVGARLPLIHDGCAATLAERFDPSCGGSVHGKTDRLSGAEIADLVAYLETL